MNNDLTKAKWLMGQHLEKEFGKAAVNEFTLFHNPSVGSTGDFWESVRDKIGVTTDVTRMFSNVLQDAQKGSKEVKWVAHSQGGIIFSEAVRYFLNGNSSWAITGGFNGAFKDKDNVSLDKHSVSFHGNGNNNIRTSILLKRAQVDVISVRANDYDLVYVVAGMNTLSPRRIVGSAVHWNHVFGGSVQQSPHTQMQTQKEWEKNMQSGPGKGRGPIQKAFKYIENYLK